MSRLAIKHKKTGLFYNDLNWVVLEKARLFKRRADLNIFLNSNCVMKYISKIGVKGLSYFEDNMKILVARESDFEIVEIELREVKR